MDIQLIGKITVEAKEVQKLSDIVYGLLLKGIYNIDIDIPNYYGAGIEDEYFGELGKMAEMILSYRQMKKINVSVREITDVFSIKQVREKDLIVCKDCPCTHCTPDRKLFKAATGFENIPSIEFCRKRFLELAVSNQLHIALYNKELSDLDENDWFDLNALRSSGYVETSN